jgi:hypothetical protein
MRAPGLAIARLRESRLSSGAYLAREDGGYVNVIDEKAQRSSTPP